MINGEVHAQTVDPNKIMCRDCIYRDKDTLNIGGKVIQTGVKRSRCMIYDGKNGNWKPNSIDIGNGKCPFYERDETAPRFWERDEG